MKLALAACVAVLAIVLVQAEDEMGPPVLPDDTRIANGRPATPGQLPFMAYIEASTDLRGHVCYCSGSLITRTAVLTTAACDGGNTTYMVRLGSIYREANDTNAWTIVSKWVLIHPKFNVKNFDNNIAIIHLPRQAPLNEFIQPVHLPSSPDASSYIGCQGIVSGWGYTSPGSGMPDILHWAELIVIPNEYCKKINASEVVTDRQLCAGSDITTAYDRDLGVPLVLNTTGGYIQIGLFSSCTTSAFNTSHPDIYTRVTSFIDWIKINTESAKND